MAKLHEAGAIILAKVNLSELASGPTMSSLGGQTHNPHNLAYSPAGSSSGTAVAVAAGYSPIGIGTDTTGSCRWPAATNGVVGLRPTTGVISMVGVMPNSPTLDTVGPITRSVEDAALVLSVLEGIDERSPADRDKDGKYPTDYMLGLRPDALRGVRIGFPRRNFTGDDPEVDSVMSKVILQLKAAGATVVDVELPTWLIPMGRDTQEVLINSESAPSLDAYLLASFSLTYPHSHAQILAMTEASIASPPPGITPNPGRLAGYRDEAAQVPPTAPYYIVVHDQGLQLIRASMKAIMTNYKLDAIIYPTQTTRINKIGEDTKPNRKGLYSNFGTSFASLAGWPELTVPGGFTSDGFPVGVSFLGPELSDQRLLGFGFAFEQKTHALHQPVTTPPLAGDRFTY